MRQLIAFCAVGVVAAKGGAVTWTDVNTEDDSYVARVYWSGDGKSVAIETLNRAQDHWTLKLADAATGRSRTVMEETAPTWVNITDACHYYGRKPQFLLASERDGHNHFYLFGMDGKQIRQVTRGNWEVADLELVDENGA